MKYDNYKDYSNDYYDYDTDESDDENGEADYYKEDRYDNYDENGDEVSDADDMANTDEITNEITEIDLEENVANEKIDAEYEIPGHKPYTEYDFSEIMEKYNSGVESLKQSAMVDAINSLTGIIILIIRHNYPTYSKEYFHDLVEEGKVGVLIGLKKYDVAKSKPSTFFYNYIIHEIQSFIDTNVNKTTAHYATNMRRINKIISDFEEKGIAYTDIDISIQTGLTIETVKQTMSIRNYRNEVNFDGCPESFINANALDSPNISPENAYIERETSELLYAAIESTLNPVEIKILEYNFGINNTKVLPYKEISKILDLPIDKIKKIRNEALLKLRKSKLKSSFNDYLVDNVPVVLDTEIPTLPLSQALANIAFLESVEINF